MPKDFQGIVDAFGSVRAFCMATGKPDATVRAWLRRDLIPADHWDDVIRAACERQIRGISPDSLLAALRISNQRVRDAQRRKAAEQAGVRVA